jgi:hypothetical protein
VCLEIDLPGNISDTFYRGVVHVTYKDSVFQASSPFRHAVEMLHMLQSKEVKPILMLYSDGCPDHRVNFHSVKLSLILLFKKLDIDMLIAARTAPGNSWANPAERITSVLNLAVQNVALTRSESTSYIEQVLKSANSMKDIRSKAAKVPNLKEEWLKSVQTIMTCLEERTSRLSLKDRPFQVGKAANDIEIQQFERGILTEIDPDIEIGKYREQLLKNKEGKIL